tara:strand:- start:858 stop:1211 length:354 start_codon:yes stop_codon:yes gene_type:complete
LAFILKKRNTYFWPINFETPVDDGKYETLKFSCEFKRIKQSQIEEYQKQFQDMKTALAASRKCAKEVVVGWKDILDEENNQIEFSTKTLDLLLETPMLAQTIAVAYIGSLNEEKAKN